MNTQAKLDSYWSARAKAYHAHHVTSNRATADRELWTELFLRFLPPAPARVLDVGTGPGYVAHILADQGYDVRGVDTAEGMLTVARGSAEERRQAQQPTAEFMLADATTLTPSLRTGEFDIVTSRFLLWTLREPELAVRAWAEAVTPGGMILAADANWYTDGIPQDIKVDSEAGPDSFVTTYDDSVMEDLPLATAASPEEYADIFRAAGLADVQVHWMPEVEALDREYGLQRGHDSQPHFMVVGRRVH